MTYNGIAQELTKDDVLTPGGKTNWSISTVRSILSNEKYRGDALLQKSYTVDFLTKKTKINEGEIPQEDSYDRYIPVAAVGQLCRMRHTSRKNAAMRISSFPYTPVIY